MDRSKINKKTSAQVILEFVSAFIVLVIFLVATVKIFAWFCTNIVERHEAFENSRTLVHDGPTVSPLPPPVENVIVVQESFYDDSAKPLDIFGESDEKSD